MVMRNFGKTGVRVSRLGFGTMRLPMTEQNGRKRVDYDLAVPLLHRAFELGVNYVDTAPFYCESDSEVAVGKALKGFRNQVVLSTKNPIQDDSYDHWMKRLESSLQKLDTDFIDFYHMWGIDLKTFREKIDIPSGPIHAALKAKEQGMIRHLSFSFHDDPENMLPIIDSGYFESVLTQYNLLDRANEAGMAHARAKGLGVVIMGPVGGGRLGAPSEIIRKMLKKDVRSTAEMALRFVLANPSVDIALSGMQNIAMLEENAHVASDDRAMTPEELDQVLAMMEENKKLADLYCTGCNYCMPCPQGINIPYVFKLMNYHRVYGLTDLAKAEYARLRVDTSERRPWEKENGVDAAKCVACGACQEKCPQRIEIIRQLADTASALAT